MVTDEEREELERASRESAAKASKLLDSELKTVMGKLDRIDELKPEIADQEMFDRLVSEVQRAIQENLALGQLEENIVALGGNAVALFRKIAGKAVLL